MGWLIRRPRRQSSIAAARTATSHAALDPATCALCQDIQPQMLRRRCQGEDTCPCRGLGIVSEQTLLPHCGYLKIKNRETHSEDLYSGHLSFSFGLLMELIM